MLIQLECSAQGDHGSAGLVLLGVFYKTLINSVWDGYYKMKRIQISRGSRIKILKSMS